MVVSSGLLRGSSFRVKDTNRTKLKRGEVSDRRDVDSVRRDKEITRRSRASLDLINVLKKGLKRSQTCGSRKENVPVS